MKIILSAINRINRFASIFAGLMTAAIAAVVCYAVIARYMLGSPVGWSEEIGSYLMIWAAFLGAGYTAQKDGHIGVDVVFKRLSSRMQEIFEAGRYLVGIGFLLLLVWKGIEDCLLSIRLAEVSISELAIPMVIPQLALPVGASLVALQLLEKLIRTFCPADDGRERSP